MKQNKKMIPFDFSALISPITPRVTSFDGLGSLFNVVGSYYDINPNWEKLWEASNHISSINDAWGNVGKDLFKVVNQFATLYNNNLNKNFPYDYNQSTYLNKSWENLSSPKKY